jgi:hypothetical protein
MKMEILTSSNLANEQSAQMIPVFLTGDPEWSDCTVEMKVKPLFTDFVLLSGKVDEGGMIDGQMRQVVSFPMTAIPFVCGRG